MLSAAKPHDRCRSKAVGGQRHSRRETKRMETPKASPANRRKLFPRLRFGLPLALCNDLIFGYWNSPEFPMGRKFWRIPLRAHRNSWLPRSTTGQIGAVQFDFLIVAIRSDRRPPRPEAEAPREEHTTKLLDSPEIAIGSDLLRLSGAGGLCIVSRRGRGDELATERFLR
jgi:hypothetical protein